MLQAERLSEKAQAPSFFNRLLRRVDGCEVEVRFDDKADADRVTIDDVAHSARERLPLFSGDEAVHGRVLLTPTGSSYHYNGVVIALVGYLSTFTPEESRKEFVRQETSFGANTIDRPSLLDFHFGALKKHESYRGIAARVTYCVQVTVQRPVKNVTQRAEVWVTNVDEALTAQQPDASAHRSYFRETEFGPDSVAMDVGVDNRLHIEFTYDKQLFHLTERVLGKVTFKLAEMDLEFGEFGVVRKEFLMQDGVEDNYEAETLQKFEIMDGTPIVGEVVPLRLYLGSVPRLTPTYVGIEQRLTVRYFLNLVLVTSAGKRYFKQQEIVLYRRRGQERPACLPTPS
ncbi:vacuolar protein sorting-associated protein [Strigomonas culicis]|uniref:Vacuolar protein sorting-associated protein n=1 Tax=Strigomonas culicis TaxID=28005 RepID=S9VLA4_9TRYP|nr:vacuolar protein sorting-associated protein [Strigomonas culicis]EPY36713.1 vacuolar protein sorting-associated protein [Strigomonas culicis]|eukprot:EPY27936.1 vacuolar protein sorting-associated protein [Strigomonas culicis]